MAVIDARSSLHPIHAEVHGLEGVIDMTVDQDGTIDAGSEAKGRIELATDRLQTGNPLYDRETRRRIDARRYPTITGVLTGLAPGSAAGRYRVEGDVTFHGVTVHHDGEMAITADQADTVLLRGTHVFDVRAFGVEPPRMLMLKVEPEVTVRVDIVAVRSR